MNIMDHTHERLGPNEHYGHYIEKDGITSLIKLEIDSLIAFIITCSKGLNFDIQTMEYIFFHFFRIDI